MDNFEFSGKKNQNKLCKDIRETVKYQFRALA